jgi:AAA domain/Bifunctional DNA primase/polymerase, N-terminal
MPDAPTLRQWWSAGYLPLYCLPNERGEYVPRRGTTGSAPWPAEMSPAPHAHYRPAIRLPAGVIALDVDCDRPEQPGKDGAATLNAMSATLGVLPPTWRLTARGPNQRSGRYLYRVPADVRLTDAPFTAAGGSVEVIRTDHRFSWAPGDIHPVTQQRVVCYDSTGAALPGWRMPPVASLPELPQPWMSIHATPLLSTESSTPVEKVRSVAQQEWDAAVADLDALLAGGRRGGWDYNSMRDAAWHLAKLAPEHAVEAWSAAFDRAGLEQSAADQQHILTAVDRAVPDTIVEVDSLFDVPVKARGNADSWSVLPQPEVGPTGRPMVVMLRSATEYLTEEARWLCQYSVDLPRQVPMGEVTIVAGKGGCGKSTFTLWMAAELSRGTLPGEYFGQPRNTVIYAREDSISQTIRPRLIAAGADLSMIKFLVRSDGQVDEMVSWTADLDAITALLRESAASLLILDPLIDAVDGDSHVAKVVRSAIYKLRTIAQSCDIAVVGLHHLSKNTKDGLAACISGSHAYQDVARAVMVFAYDGEQKNFVFAQIKNSLQRDVQELVFNYEMQSVDVPTDKGGKTNVARWVIGDETDRTVEEAVDSGRRPTSHGGVTRPDETLDWLADYLAGGQRLASEVEEHYLTVPGDMNGDKATFKTVRNRVSRSKHFESRRETGSTSGRWYWSLTGAGYDAYGLSAITDSQPPWLVDPGLPEPFPCIPGN